MYRLLVSAVELQNMPVSSRKVIYDPPFAAGCRASRSKSGIYTSWYTDYSYFGQLAKKKKGGITLTMYNYLKLIFFFFHACNVNSGNQKI